MIDILVYLAIFAIVAILVWYVLQQVPLPPPLKQILLIVVVVIGGIILIDILLNFTGYGVPLRIVSTLGVVNYG